MTDVKLQADPLIAQACADRGFNAPRFVGEFSGDNSTIKCAAQFATVKQVSAWLGVSDKSIYRWRRHGINLDKADKLAVSIGHHPLEIWHDFHQGTEA